MASCYYVDLCDSSAAYLLCRFGDGQVPEGNWCCDDCRPVCSWFHMFPSSRILCLINGIQSNNIFNRPSPILILDARFRSHSRVSTSLYTSPQVSGKSIVSQISDGRYSWSFHQCHVAGAFYPLWETFFYSVLYGILLSNRNPSGKIESCGLI
ncbi:hypothetical protein NC652_030423 [Populus alba x Populus x berolinensis]|nr:hypothetical protein NC652_030423 [Populus alba x Populus x berolinensis]